MRAIVINAKDRTITATEIDGSLTSLQQIVGGLIEPVYDGLDDAHHCYVNEEGFLDQPHYFFMFKGGHQPLAGNGVIVGSGLIADEAPCSLSLDWVNKHVTFMDLAAVHTWGDTRRRPMIWPLRNLLQTAQWRLRYLLRRWHIAFAYARGRLTTGQANEIISDCEPLAGWFSLETFSIDQVLDTALDCHWQDHPALESLVHSACARVASKWSSDGHAADIATDRALDLVEKFAAARGIALVHREE
jgi:Domain of unknown function (DUF3846)